MFERVLIANRGTIALRVVRACRKAIEAILRTLEEYMIDGVATTIPFHRRLLTFRDFLEGRVHTKSVEEDFLRTNSG